MAEITPAPVVQDLPPDIGLEPELCDTEHCWSPADDIVFKDDLYYSSFIQFEVEDLVMLVPGYHFTDSSHFHGGESTGDFGTKDRYISLHDVKIEDFHSLLTVMYPLSPLEDEPIAFKDCTSVLALATKYDLIKIRNFAIAEVQKRKTSPLERITLGRAYGHPRWLLSGYMDLAKRGESITFEEARELGLTAAVKICLIRQSALRTHDIKKREIARERNRYGSYNSSTPTEPKSAEEKYLEKIDSLFDQELSSIRLTVTDAIDRAIRARALGIPEWLRYCYLELARRPDGLSEKETERLGLEASIRIFQIKESILSGEGGGSNEPEFGLRGSECEQMVRAQFELELGQVRRDEAVFGRFISEFLAEPRERGVYPKETAKVAIGKKKKKKL